MEWAVGGILVWGAIVYFWLALIGAGKSSNLKGFRWRLLGMCMAWPATLIVLGGALIWKAIARRKADVPTPPLKADV